MSAKGESRGQTLVLMGLVLLLLVIMVCMSLSLGQVARKKMELQVSADTAAFSQAVVTARTFNSVALMNRAQLGHMVALAGVQSAVSYAGSYRALLNATWYSYWDEYMIEYCKKTPMPGYPKPCPWEPARNHNFDKGPPSGNCFDWSYFCKDAHNGEDQVDRNLCYGPVCTVRWEIMGYGKDTGNPYETRRLPLLTKEFDRVKALWQELDTAAANQSYDLQGYAMQIGGYEAAALMGSLGGQLGGGQLARKVVQKALPQATVPGAAAAVSTREVNSAISGGSTEVDLHAAMGSRAHLFTTTRADGMNAYYVGLRRVLGPAGAADEVRLNTLKGNGYFDTAKNHGATASTWAAWGDEHAQVWVDYKGIDAALGFPGVESGTNTYEGWVSSTDLQDRGDTHYWDPPDFKPDETPPPDRHTLRPHQTFPKDTCPGASCIWPSFYDFNTASIASPGDAFGQPKTMVLASRDLAADPVAPWNLLFKFRFNPDASGTPIDLRSGKVHQGGGPSATLQSSVATSIAYYHRPGHWKEPPNFFNPYWRAGLTHADVDASGMGDLGTVLSSAPGAGSAAAQQLISAGYTGIP